MKTRKSALIGVAIGAFAVVAIACGTEPVTSSQEEAGDVLGALAPGEQPLPENPGIAVGEINPSDPNFEPEDGVAISDPIPVEPDYPIGGPVEGSQGIAVGEPNPSAPDYDYEGKVEIGDVLPVEPDYPIGGPLPGDSGYDNGDIAPLPVDPDPGSETDEPAVEEPIYEVDEPAPEVPLCIMTLMAVMPIEFEFGAEAIPTGFDGGNLANCSFSHDIEKVTVVLTGVDGGPSHTEIWTLPEPTTSVSFPLPENLLSFGTREMLLPGKYERQMVATSVDGIEYDLTKYAGAENVVKVLGS